MKKKFVMAVCALACSCSLSGCASIAYQLYTVQDKVDSYLSESGENSSEDSEETASESNLVDLGNGVTFEPADGVTVVEEDGSASDEDVLEDASEHSESSEHSEVSIPSGLSDDLFSFQVAINGTVYQFPMWYSDFEDMGWTYAYDAESHTLDADEYTYYQEWTMDGFTIYADFANLSVNTKPYSQCEVAGISFQSYYWDDCDWEIIMPKGIQYGVSTVEDIIAAYGTPSYEHESTYSYTLEYELDYVQKVSFKVDNETNVLSDIEIRNITELEGIDNSVSLEVPDIINNYVAPVSVGDDLYAFNIELEGHLYSLPCPISELLANGFEIVEEESAEMIPAGDYEWITLSYNGDSFSSLVDNPTTYATIPENCFLTSIEVSTGSYYANYDLTVPCDIKLGDSESSLLEKLEGFNYETSTYSSGTTYYYVYNPDGSTFDRYEFSVRDGVITGIRVDNDNYPE